MGSLIIRFATTIYFTAGITVIPLNNDNIFIETLGITYLYNEVAQITVGFDINDVFKNLNQFELHVKSIIKYYTHNCPYEHKIQTLQTRITPLNDLSLYLQLMTRNKNRRGLLNIIGSASKTLFGTLDSNDLDVINANMDKLFDDENKLKVIISNQIALIRKLVNSDSISCIEEISKRLRTNQQIHERNELITATIIRADNSAYDLRFQIDELIKAIIMGKQKMVSPQLIDHKQFLDA